MQQSGVGEIHRWLPGRGGPGKEGGGRGPGAFVLGGEEPGGGGGGGGGWQGE